MNKRKVRPIVARNQMELAAVLGLGRLDGVEIAVRSALNTKLIELVAKKHLTHSTVAKLAKTSRTRVTAIMNRNTTEISTDLMLRILASLGYVAKITFAKAA